jgi:hypothetical protein
MCTSDEAQETGAVVGVFVAALLSFASTGCSLAAMTVHAKRSARSQFLGLLTPNILLSDCVHAFGGIVVNLVWLASPLDTDDICDINNWADLKEGYRQVFIVGKSLAAGGFSASGCWILAATWTLWFNEKRGSTPRQMRTFHSVSWSVGAYFAVNYAIGFSYSADFLNIIQIQEAVFRTVVILYTGYTLCRMRARDRRLREHHHAEPPRDFADREFRMRLFTFIYMLINLPLVVNYYLTAGNFGVTIPFRLFMFSLTWAYLQGLLDSFACSAGRDCISKMVLRLVNCCCCCLPNDPFEEIYGADKSPLLEVLLLHAPSFLQRGG